MAVSHPPGDIAPREFFEEWLPKTYAAHVGARGPAGGPIEVRVRLEGEGGGDWDLRVDEKGLAVRPSSPGDELPITIRQSVEDWREVLEAARRGGGAGATGPGGSALDLLTIDPAMRQMLAAIKATVRFEITGVRGRTWALSLKLGPQPMAPQPNATITVDAETYAALAARKLAPAEAWFNGRIKIAGDAALAMQVAMALMPKFSR